MNYVQHFARKYLELALSNPKHGLHPGAVNDVIDLALSRLDANVGEPGWKSIASDFCVAGETGAERGDIGFWLADLKQHQPLYFSDAPADDAWTEEKLARLEPHVRAMVETNLARQRAEQNSGGANETSGMTPLQKMQAARGAKTPDLATTEGKLAFIREHGSDAYAAALADQRRNAPDLNGLSPTEKMVVGRRIEAAKKTQLRTYEEWQREEGGKDH